MKTKGNSFWRPLVVSIAVMGAVNPAQSAYWYVDNAATGANNGASWANAWTSFSKVVWGTSGVKAGDTLYISGGKTSKTYTEKWTVGASGASGSPITITVDGGNTNHNGVVVFDMNAWGDTGSGTVIGVANRSYIVISGNVNGDCRIAISNFRNINDNIAAAGISGYSTANMLIEYVSFTNDNNPINLALSAGFEIRNCVFAGVRGDAAIGVAGSTGGFDSSRVHHNTFTLLYNNAQPPGATYAYGGPDGVQCGSGVSLYNNRFTALATNAFYTSTQHPDLIQAQGNYIKFYNNDIINIGDSAIDIDCFSNPTPHDYWIYNNVFRIVSTVDLYPEYFRLYTSAGAITSIVNIKIWNNTFVDNTAWGSVKFYSYNGNPTSSGCEVRNNLFLNCGVDQYKPTLSVGSSSGFALSDWLIDYNVYAVSGYVIFEDVNYTRAQWIAAKDIHGKTTTPSFVSYSPNAAGNDFHLSSSDAVARGGGVNLSSYFTTDKDGNTRAASPAAWDIGAYSTQQVVVGISVVPAALDFGLIGVGSSTSRTLSVYNSGVGILAGSASVSAPFTIVSGSPYSIAAGQSQAVTVRYAPVSSGANSQTISFTGGSGTVATASGSAWGPPTVSAITQGGADVDLALPGLQVYAGSVVQYSGVASDPNGYPVTWQWFYATNGLSVLAGSGTGSVASLSYNYTADTAGKTYIWTLRVNNGKASVETNLTVGVEAPPQSVDGLTFLAGAGVITAPFVYSTDSISQPLQTTDPTAGGRAAYSFTINSAANYVIQVLLNAPNDAANSLFLNIDAEPQSPSMIWDIPLTSGFEARVLSWRGSGTFDNNQYTPKVFALSQGAHQLIIRGREPDVQVARINILQLPPPPRNLRVIPTL